MSYYMELLEKHGLKLKDEQITLRNAIRQPVYPSIAALGKYEDVSYEQLMKGDEYTDRPRKTDRRLRPADKRFDKETGHRICSNCHEAKPPEMYAKGNGVPDGKDPRCKECKKTIAAERFKRQREGWKRP